MPNSTGTTPTPPPAPLLGPVETLQRLRLLTQEIKDLNARLTHIKENLHVAK